MAYDYTFRAGQKITNKQLNQLYEKAKNSNKIKIYITDTQLYPVIFVIKIISKYLETKTYHSGLHDAYKSIEIEYSWEIKQTQTNIYAIPI